MPALRKVGINNPGVSNFAYVDDCANRATHMGPWQSGDVNVATDAFGNPTVAAASSYFSQSKFGIDGVYNCSFNSSTAVTITMSFGYGTITNQVFNSGLTTFTLTIPISVANGNVNVQFNYSGATGGIQNLIIARTTESLVYSPTVVGTFAGPTGQITAATYRNIIPAGIVLRFMDRVNTNFNVNGTWATRTLPGCTNFSMSPSPYVSPWEHIIKMSNELGAHPYICVPVNADNTYITNLANMFKYGSDGTNAYTSVQANPVWPPLNSNLNVYPEYANETWNFFTSVVVEIQKQMATATIPVTGLSVTGGNNNNVAVFQGASLGTATWKAIKCGDNIAAGASSGTIYVLNQSGTYAPGALTINETTPVTGTGGALAATGDTIAAFFDTNYPNDYYANIYRRHAVNTLRVSEGFRAVWGSIDMPENKGRVRPMMLAQLGYDAGPLASMFSVFSPIQDNANGLSQSIPTITTRPPNQYLYGMGCSYYYGFSYLNSAVAAASAVANGTSITLTYPALLAAVPVGGNITTSGLTFTGFTNGQFVVTASTTTSVTFASTATAGASSTSGSFTYVPNTVDDLFGPGSLYLPAGFATVLAQTSRWAATFGLKFVAYEGFLSLSGPPNINAEKAVLADSRIIPKILQYESAFYQAGGDMACAFTVDATSNSDWSMVYDQRDPTRTTKYTAWLATVGLARPNATVWYPIGATIPGAQWATRLDSSFTASPYLQTTPPTGGLICNNGYHVSYVWYNQTPLIIRVYVNITASVAGTMDLYFNGSIQHSAQAYTVGTNSYEVTYFGNYCDGPMVSATVHFKTGSGGTINYIATTV